LGPDLPTGRTRIRISGAKKMEATLPTSVERFRAALLTVFRNPQFVERRRQSTDREDGEPDVQSGGTEPDEDLDAASTVAEETEAMQPEQPPASRDEQTQGETPPGNKPADAAIEMGPASETPAVETP
ncbi:MAG: hypothetical protein ACR2PL_01820, partial [Dehalococcoidia bacterium]